MLVGGYFAIFGKKEKASNESSNVQDEKQPRLSISKNPQQFNDAFSNMLNSYYNVKNDLINWDSTKAGNDATTLAQLASATTYQYFKRR